MTLCHLKAVGGRVKRNKVLVSYGLHGIHALLVESQNKKITKRNFDEQGWWCPWQTVFRFREFVTVKLIVGLSPYFWENCEGAQSINKWNKLNTVARICSLNDSRAKPVSLWCTLMSVATFYLFLFQVCYHPWKDSNLYLKCRLADRWAVVNGRCRYYSWTNKRHRRPAGERKQAAKY